MLHARTTRDKVKGVDVRMELGVNSIQEKFREMRLHWYGDMQRMEENNEVRAVVDMIVPGKRPRGRPRGRWMDGVRSDMQELRLTPEDAQDRTFLQFKDAKRHQLKRLNKWYFNLYIPLNQNSLMNKVVFGPHKDFGSILLLRHLDKIKKKQTC